jgi:hypothetical protein
MPIIDIQRRLAQTGRIRIGEVVHATNAQGKAYTRPKKSETFRLTSSSESAIISVAKKYGGNPQIWEDAPAGRQWEVMTESMVLDILIPPESMSFSQYYELWSGGGCQRRCNGAFQVPSEEDCVCDPNNRECKPHTRLSVMLADLPGAGLWRLDTQGWNAANEISGAFELATLISKARGISILPGVLRLDQRETKRPDATGKPVTRKFAVPVIDFDLDLAALARGTQVAISSPITPISDDGEPLSVAEQLERVNTPVEKPKRSNAAEPIKPTGIAPRARGVVHEDDEPVSSAKSPFDAAFGMLVDEEQVEARSKFIAAKLSLPTSSWNAEQTERGLAIVHEILNATTTDSNPQVQVETVKPDAIIPPKASKNKITQLNIRFQEAGFKDRQVIHDYAAKSIFEAEVLSLNDLTTAQANQVIAQLASDFPE